MARQTGLAQQDEVAMVTMVAVVVKIQVEVLEGSSGSWHKNKYISMTAMAHEREKVTYLGKGLTHECLAGFEKKLSALQNVMNSNRICSGENKLLIGGGGGS
jgi:hypothetical protein